MKLIAIAFFALFSLALTARAQLVLDIVGGDDLAVGPGTAGFAFTVTEPTTLRSLGLYASSETLFNAHSIGIWDVGTQTLLSSVRVDPFSATKVGAFWYAALAAPLTLASGREYALAASYADNDFDFALGNAAAVTLAPFVTLGAPLLSSGSGFEFPDLRVEGAALGFFGPNALVTAVPEPAQLALIAAFVLVLWTAVRNIRRRGGALALVGLCSLSVFAEERVSVRAVLDATLTERPRLLRQLARERPLAAFLLSEPAANRPPVTPGNTNGNRPLVPPGLRRNYASP